MIFLHKTMSDIVPSGDYDFFTCFNYKVIKQDNTKAPEFTIYYNTKTHGNYSIFFKRACAFLMNNGIKINMQEGKSSTIFIVIDCKDTEAKKSLINKLLKTIILTIEGRINASEVNINEYV